MSILRSILLEADEEDEKKEDSEKEEKEDDKDNEEKDSSSDDEDDSDYEDYMPDPDDGPMGEIENTDDKDSDSSFDYDDITIGDNDHDDSSDFDSDDLYSKIAKCAYACVLVSNNMKHIHLNVVGRKFDTIHNLTDKYYGNINYISDTLFEIAMEKTNRVDNPTNAPKHCPDIRIESDDNYEYDNALDVISDNLRSLIDYFKEARSVCDSRPDIQSKLDDELSFLNKELNFIVRRSRSSSSDESYSESTYIYNQFI